MGVRRWESGGQGKNCGMKKFGLKTFFQPLKYILNNLLNNLNLPIQQTNSFQ
jgi:hypothetical protein